MIGEQNSGSWKADEGVMTDFSDLKKLNPTLRKTKEQFILLHRTQKAQELATAVGQSGLKVSLRSR